jgi:hypothetical protein
MRPASEPLALPFSGWQRISHELWASSASSSRQNRSQTLWLWRLGSSQWDVETSRLAGQPTPASHHVPEGFPAVTDPRMTAAGQPMRWPPGRLQFHSVHSHHVPSPHLRMLRSWIIARIGGHLGSRNRLAGMYWILEGIRRQADQWGYDFARMSRLVDQASEKSLRRVSLLVVHRTPPRFCHSGGGMITHD